MVRCAVSQRLLAGLPLNRARAQENDYCRSTQFKQLFVCNTSAPVRGASNETRLSVVRTVELFHACGSFQDGAWQLLAFEVR